MTTDSDSQPRRRPYQLTPEGRASLQASAARVKPWERSTGPRTPDGKSRSRMNAWKHGERSAQVVEQRAMARDILWSLRELSSCHTIRSESN